MTRRLEPVVNPLISPIEALRKYADWLDSINDFEMGQAYRDAADRLQELHKKGRAKADVEKYGA